MRLRDKLLSVSPFKQDFCFHKEKNSPEKFANRKCLDFDHLLEVRSEINNDIRFGKVLFTYLIFPSYFSKEDYLTLIRCFLQIGLDLQIKIGIYWSYPLLHFACINSQKYPLGLYNFIALLDSIPSLSNYDRVDCNGETLLDLMQFYFSSNNTTILGSDKTISDWLDEANLVSQISKENCLSEEPEELEVVEITI